MKKTIQHLASIASMALCALCSPLAASAANGHIFDIFPSDEFGKAVSLPVASADAPLGGGEKVNFVVRMYKADNSSSSTKWRLKHIGLNSEAVDAVLNPFGIGIYVSGEIRIATLKSVLSTGDYFSDFVFEYITRPGDFALPIVLATADGKPASDTAVSDLSYYVSPASLGVWSIVDGAGAPANFWWGAPTYPGVGAVSSADYCMRGAGFYVKTIDFDSNFEVPNADSAQAIWRTVHESSTIPGGATPSIAAVGMPTNAVTLYVWSKDETGVRVDGGVQRDIHVTATTTEKRWVKEIKVVAGKLEYPFEIYGLAKGQYDHLVLSAYPDFNYHAGTNDRHNDFVTVRVQCSEPLPPSVRIAPAKTPITATSDYTHYATELLVSFTQPYTEDVEITITPSFENGAAVSWGDYIRFSDSQDLTSLPEAVAPKVTIKAGKLVPETKLYVFALKSDENTVGVANHIQFAATTDSTGANGAIQDWGDKQGAINIDAQDPVILTPAEGDSTLTAVAGAQRTLRITVADTYADMASDLGYEIYILKNSDTESSYTKLDGTYKLGQGGFLFKVGGTDELPSVVYSETGVNKTTIYVKSPVSGKQSAERNFTCTVTAPAGFTVEAIDGKTNNEYVEGDDVSIEIKLDRQNTTGGSLYAFLVPVTDKDKNAVDCSFLAENGGYGLEIPQYGTSVTGYFTLVDGCTGAANSQFSYKVELRTARGYNDAGATTVSSFMCKNTLGIKSSNVIPKVDTVMMGLNETNDEGKFDGIVIAKGVEQTFKANVTEPGKYDLTATGDEAFQTRWIFKTTGYSPAGPSNGTGENNSIIVGDPEENGAKFTFNRAGTWTVTVELRDKDMSNWGNGELKGKYTFEVVVVDQPAITITGRTESGDEAVSFYETESADAGGSAYIDVNLAMNKCDFDLEVEVAITSGDTSSPTPGQFVLLESANVKKKADVDNVYVFTFPAGETTVPAIIKTLDGTVTSRTQGFILTPAAVTKTVVPESGSKPANEYYVGTAKTLKVNNSVPTVDEADLYPAPGTTNMVAIGAADPITWNFTDVLPDFEGGITVTVKGGGGFSETVTTMAGAAGTFTPNFASSGPQTVQLTIKDKDNGQISFIWYYEVEVAKTLSIVAHGPSAGNGTANSKRYRTAAGLGEGRVWAEGLSNIKNFESFFNCGKSSTWTIYGKGYKVDEVDETINTLGNQKATTEPGPYAYTKLTDKYGQSVDSFLYTWLQVVAAEEGGSLTDQIFSGATSPEYSAISASGTRVALPSEQNDDGSFLDTMLEAIFAREYLATDNMGDINQDGIPDIYVDKYGMGVVDTATGLVSGDDLASLKGFNEDLVAPDFLPANATSGYGSLIPGLEESWATLGQPFTAFLEIRGYGEGLNDAPVLAGIPNVKPDRVYTNPNDDLKSTLSYVEFLAWEEFAAANGLDVASETDWAKWSPERPTDPMKADTDDDGFTDGYEYYFWYRAHVGYMEGDNHRYLTGRAYDPRNPGEGKLISAKEIAALMDPITPSGDAASAATRDIDNDGLPDLLEFLIGTNPFDFDTDGDGLADGWELMIAGTSPVMGQSYADEKGTGDTIRNDDGDAMAFTTQFREKEVLPLPLNITERVTFAVIDANGDTDGKQWYVVKAGDEAAITYEIDETQKGTLLSVNGAKYIATVGVKVTSSGRRLASNLTRGDVYAVTNAADVAESVPGVTAEYLRLAPVSLEAGLKLDEDPVTDTAYAVATLSAAPEAGKCNAAWVYGNPGIANYGMLALARYQTPEVGAVLCEVPSKDREVALLHSLVYQEYGFDPRTAWSEKSPIAVRWGSTSSDGEAIEGVYRAGQGGYASRAVRTRAYAMYDEFLVMSFFLNNGVDMSFTYRASIGDAAPEWARIWDGLTTNPQGPESGIAVSDENYYGRNDPNGADTDGDGVPDGWELYTMAGPKTKEGLYVFAPPWAGFNTALSPEPEYKTPESFWSPFVASAGKNDTDNQIYLGGQAGSDGLNQLREFGGTDSCAHYAEVSTTIKRHESDAKWLNKFFPTDPWSVDTDGDGVKDSAEGTTFVYGSPADNGKLWSIPGGGLNPCTVDTDLDGLPDTWEAQYKGKTVYAGEDAEYAAGTADGAKGNPLQGLTDGMDGTVCDSYSVPTTLTVIKPDGRIFSGKVNRDYDRDGLENWQEYMTGTMRCWRYDDPFSPWTAIPKETYFTYNEDEDKWSFNLDNAVEKLGCASTDEFWYKTLVDKASGIYNPYMVTDCSSGWQYFSCITNGWDLAYAGETSPVYYYFADTINGEKINKAWGEAHGLTVAPATIKYAGCSPLKADSDQDGMDDYYELFHGMNPLLGDSGVEVASNGPCDLIADAWSTPDGITIEAWSDDLTANYWTQQVKAGNFYKTGKEPKGNGYDFEYYPWLNGATTADPDGDDIRNQQEAIMPTVNINAKHTDPTPLWMTDSSYSNSLVRMFFRMPARFDDVELGADTFANPENPDEVYSFKDFFGYVPAVGMDPAKFTAFNPDAWNLAAAGEENWMFSFEENEGFDTDHDGMSDFDESTSRFRDASDANDFDSPRRRQAMYFGGEYDPSVLQTLPREKERHPVSTSTYPESTDFCHFTVECWVKNEGYSVSGSGGGSCGEGAVVSYNDATVIERAVQVEKSNPGDNSYIRRNFHLGVKNGKWYAAYDSAGTLASSVVEAEGIAATDDWTHLAATYDGKALKLYVNGVQVANTLSSVDPEYGASALNLHDVSKFWGVRDYELIATTVGAGIRKDGDYGSALALTSEGAVSYKNLSAYEKFFEGWIDEIRIWDGARTSEEIVEAMKVRFTAAEAAANRDAVYNEWKEGNRRYVAGNTARAELRYHYNFDALFGAMTDEYTDLRRTPNGFTDGNTAKTVLSRPDDWQINWLSQVLEAHGSAYRCDPAQGDVWATWIHNTVAHLPRFDGTTLDSVYWSKDFEGWKLGSYAFAQTAEPYSKWTQMVYNNAITASSGEFGGYATTGARFTNLYGNPYAQFVDTNGVYDVDYTTRFEFTGRNLNQQGDDMIALGGAFAKYVETMWDENGPSSPWEYTGVSSSLDGIPEWWQEFAFGEYDPDGRYQNASEIKWDSIVVWNGREMTARDAYWRDLAAGMMIENGEVVVKGEFEQVADINGDGLSDWWENMFGISTAKIADDTDNDGLADFAEYLISEVFQFAPLNPRMARTDGYRLDYFNKIGSLYFGELLSDHDFMEDGWETLFSVKSVSSGIYDAHADGDSDGWSNFAECRAGTSPARTSYLGVDGSTIGDYPTPIVKLTCSYKGAQNAAIYPVVVKAYSKRNNSSMPDALWSIAALVNPEQEEGKEDGSSSSGSDGKQDGDDEEGGEENSAIVPTGRKHLGMNPGTVVKLNLGPGSVVAGSVRIMFKDLAWGYQVLRVGDDGYPVQVAKRMGETEKASWLLGAVDKVRAGDTVYGDLMVKLVASYDGAEMNFDSVVGVINYQTGEATIDFSKFGESYRFGELKSIGPETYEIKYIEPARSYACVEWASKITTTGYPKTFYLADADLNSVERPSYGHLYEGENWFEAFVDMDGDGQYSAGEPYGFKRGVDIGWSGTEFNIELTDTSPVFGRFRFDGTAWTCDRVVVHGSEADVISDTNTSFAVSGGLQDRLRVVRYALNNGNLSGGSMVAVADKLIDFSVRPYITEADVLPDGKFDIEELGFLGKSTVDVNYSVYALVFGDGDLTTGLADNRVAPYKVVRRFDSVRQKPTIVTDGKPTMFHGAQPTFTWTTGIYNTYSSFRVQVRDAASKVVYDSGDRLAPARDAEGNYNWTPDDLFVDDQCKAGNTAMVFSNTNQYTYRVQMCNAKYGESTSAWSADSPQFRMHVNANAEANDTGYSCVKVSVKYFGPDEVVEDALAAGFKGKIRVEAFTSPDFTGTPVARAFYSDDEVALDDDDYSANVVLKGIPSGSYYIRAYIDSDGDFKRSDWESWGYANRRDMTTSGNIFAPVSVTVGPDVALAPLVTVYIEDTDLDGDWLPDAWEWVTSGGSFTAKGPGEFFDKNVFGFADDFQKRFSRVSASGNKLGSNLRALSSSTMNTSDMTALLLGVNTSGYDSSAAALSAWVSPELVEDGISIESLKIENGKVFIKVAGETSAPDSANASSSVYTFAGGDVRTLSVTCNVYVKENLASDEWKLAKSERITVGGEAVEIDAGEAGAASGFYKVEVVK